MKYDYLYERNRVNLNKLKRNSLIFSILFSNCLLNNSNSFAQDTVYNDEYEHVSNLVSEAELYKSTYYKEMAQDALDKLADSQIKISLQERINAITTSSLSHSGNIDVYIKPQNILSLSLNTNVVTFEDYSGTESLEKLSAIELTVDSTLPYDLNSYLETEIVNKDGDKFLNRNVLNLKESSTTEYKHFNNVKEKLTLLSDCNAGYSKTHSIDMKLNPSVFETDVYKTVIKFEIEQK